MPTAEHRDTAIMKPPRTHYDNLKITQDATPQAIKAAYKTLSQKHHPDKNNHSPQSQQAMKIINQAYQTLSDPIKRQQHDLWIKDQQPSQHQSTQQNANKPHQAPPKKQPNPPKTNTTEAKQTPNKPTRSTLSNTINTISKIISITLGTVALIIWLGVVAFFLYDINNIHIGAIIFIGILTAALYPLLKELFDELLKHRVKTLYNNLFKQHR